MALFNCPECGKEISDKACSCPGCGFPIRHDNFAETAKEAAQEELQQCPKCNFSFPISQNQCPRCGCRLVSENSMHIRLGKTKDVNFQSTSSELSVIGFILSIFSLLTTTVSYITSIFFMILGFAFCSSGKRDKTHSKKGLATVGEVMCALTLVIILLSFSGEENSKKNIVESSNTDSKVNVEEDNKEELDLKKVIAIEEQVICDKNNVIIKVVGCEELQGGLVVNFYIENNSDLNLGFNAHSYAVNNIMTRDSIYAMDCDVAAGKKANTEIVIDESFLDNYDIDTIKTIDVLFWAYDNDAMFKEFDTGQIEIHTNMYDETVDLIVGERLYEENGIIVDCIGNDGDSYTYCLTNNTGNYFDFDVSNISINDYTVSDTDYDLYDEQVLNNCQIVFVINVSQNFKEKNGIEAVKKIEFNFDIRPAGDYFNNWLSSTVVHEFK